MDTRGPEYADRLRRLEGARWKRWLDVQAPYRWKLRSYDLGRTLDVGCGIGRNLATLPSGSLGVDHNADSVAIARERGLSASTSEELLRAEPTAYDAILLAHVLEHMTRPEAVDLVRTYLPWLRPGGQVLVVCPQPRGYRSDETHVTYLDGEAIAGILAEAGIEPGPAQSFPLPRWAGGLFTYNETHVLGRLPG